nr:hypothetical protein [Pedobacter panaciterrae]
MARQENLDEVLPEKIIRIKGKIANILKDYSDVAPSRTRGLLPIKSFQGKLYEAHVLASILKNLATKEFLTFKLKGGSALRFKQKGGPINRSYPYFEVYKLGKLIGELFTDQYFSTISYKLKGSPPTETGGDFHELDIALIKPGQSGNPPYTSILLAIECKNTSIKKSTIREILGYRRELSFYTHKTEKTEFNNWPISLVPATPPSVHMLYCSDPNVEKYSSNCETYGTIIKLHQVR